MSIFVTHIVIESPCIFWNLHIKVLFKTYMASENVFHFKECGHGSVFHSFFIKLLV